MMHLPDIEDLRLGLDAIEEAIADDDAAALSNRCALLVDAVAPTPCGDDLLQALHHFVTIGGDFQLVRNAFEDFAADVASWQRACDSEGGEL